jgi:hypothetical protein
MNTLSMLLVLLAFSMNADARPIHEYSDDGMSFRIFNPDDRAYYCIITLGTSYPFEKIVYPKQYTRWYSMRGGYATDCET